MTTATLPAPSALPKPIREIRTISSAPQERSESACLAAFAELYSDCGPAALYLATRDLDAIRRMVEDMDIEPWYTLGEALRFSPEVLLDPHHHWHAEVMERALRWQRGVQIIRRLPVPPTSHRSPPPL